MEVPFTALRASIQAILERPAGFDWTVQGFGMIRTYFGSKRWRLNVWHSSLACNASTIHDHPWDFQSWIIAGALTNIRYHCSSPHEPTHHYMDLHTGIEGGSHGEVKDAFLAPFVPRVMFRGETYRQSAKEVHETLYDDGTVTLNQRVGDTEHARVFWPYGTEWVDAKPRVASLREVATVTEAALMVMKGEQL